MKLVYDSLSMICNCVDLTLITYEWNLDGRKCSHFLPSNDGLSFKLTWNGPNLRGGGRVRMMKNMRISTSSINCIY